MKKFAAAAFVVLFVLAGAGMYSLRGILDIAENRMASALQKEGWTVSMPEKAELRFFALSPTIRYENVAFQNGQNRVEIGELQVSLAWLPLFQKHVVIKKALVTESKIVLAGREGNISLLKVRKNASNTAVKGFFDVQGIPFRLSGDCHKGQCAFGVNGDNLFARLEGTENKGYITASLKLSATKMPAAAPDLAVAAQITGTADKWDVPSFTVNWGGKGSTLLKAQGGYVNHALNADFSGILPNVAAVPLAFDGTIKTAETGDFSESITLSGGKTAAKITVKGTADALDAAVEADVADLSELLPLKGGTLPPIFPKKIALSDLKEKQVRLSVEIEKLIGANGRLVGEVNVKARKKADEMNVSAFKIGAFASGTAVVSGKEKRDLSVRLRLNSFPAAAFGYKNGIKKGTLSGSVKLNAKEAPRGDVAGAMNGTVRLSARNWRIEPAKQQTMPRFIESIISDFTQPMNMSCAVVNVPVQNGVLVSNRQIALESDLLNMQLNGMVNFRENALNMRLSAVPKKGGVVPALLSNAMIEGTLDDPVFRLNTESGLQRAVSYGLAFLQGGQAAARQMLKTQDDLNGVCRTALESETR